MECLSREETFAPSGQKDSRSGALAPPNKALQLTSHSAFQSACGRVWHRTWALRASRGGAVARS